MKSFPGAARTLALSALAVILAGCAATAGIAPHEKALSDEAYAQKLNLKAQGGPGATAADWWTVYQDPQLNHWMDLGLADSPSLRAAATRVQLAQAALSLAHSAELPSLAASADSTAERLSRNGIFPPPLGGMVHTVNDVDLAASLELDIFGRLAARTDAEKLRAEASEADQALARARLSAAIAHAYFELAHAQEARRVAVELEAARTGTLELVQRRVSAGLDTQVERRLAEVTVPQIRVDIEQAGERIALARHSLALLAGQPPQAADAVDAKLPDDRLLAAPTALPLDLLARRPDIAAAQRRVRATLRDVDAARADFYPNVNLSAIVGLNSLTTQTLFEAESRTWQVGPAVHLPLFQGGALRARLRAASAQADAAVDDYHQTVLQAAGEVADSVTSIASVRKQRGEQALATSSAQAAADLAEVRYKAGLGNYLTVLTAQTNVLAQRRSDVDLAARAAALDVSLALAMGGGFHTGEVQQ